MAHEKSKEQQNIDETAYLEECRARRQRLSRYRVAASNTAGLLSVGVLGLELSRKLGYGNVCSNGEYNIKSIFERQAGLCI